MSALAEDGGDPRGRALSRYVEARYAGRRPDPVRDPAAGPMGVLLAAKLGDPAAREGLAEAARRDLLVGALARLDPELSGLIE